MDLEGLEEELERLKGHQVSQLCECLPEMQSNEAPPCIYVDIVVMVALDQCLFYFSCDFICFLYVLHLFFSLHNLIENA